MRALTSIKRSAVIFTLLMCMAAMCAVSVKCTASAAGNSRTTDNVEAAAGSAADSTQERFKVAYNVIRRVKRELQKDVQRFIFLPVRTI